MQTLNSKGAVEILTPKYGSGYRIGGRLVLTSAHLFTDPISKPVEIGSTCTVRSKIDKKLGNTEARLVWRSDQADVALVELPSSISPFRASRFGLIQREMQTKTIDFELYGWPQWARTKRPGENAKTGGRHITGKIYLADTSGEDLLVVEPERLPEAPIPGERGSQWEGISGAAVFCDGLIVAVQRHHQNTRRPASLEAQPLSTIYSDSTWRTLLEEHGINSKPKRVSADTTNLDPRPTLATVGVTSGIVTLLILLIRTLGLLQLLELSAYDFLLSNRPRTEQDQHVAVIGIDTNEVEISDDELLTLLQKLNEEDNRPKVIGIDIYRNGANKELRDFLEASNNVISSCQLNARFGDDGTLIPDGQPPYPEIKQTDLGFTDFFSDGNWQGDPGQLVARRQLLQVHPEIIEERLAQEDSLCKPQDSLSFRLAYRYLSPLEPEYASDAFYITLGKIKLHPLNHRAGGYQRWDSDTDFGYQVMVNYRPLGKQGYDSFYSKEYTTSDILSLDSESLRGFKNKLVLIGYTSLNRNVNEDTILTPVFHKDLLTNSQIRNGNQPNVSKKMPGVVVHAHMASQIVNAVIENRPLIWIPHWSLDIVWTLSWVSAASSISWLLRKPLWKFLSYVLLMTTLGFACYFILLISGGWMPLIPPVLGCILIALSMWLYSRISFYR